MNFVTTWPTLKTELYKMAETSPFLKEKMHERPTGDCVTFYLILQALGSKLGHIQDSVPTSPRSRQLDSLIKTLIPHLDSPQSEERDAQIRLCMENIQGDNADHYVPALPSEISHGAKELFCKWNQSLPDQSIIVTEFATFQALQQQDKEWFHNFFDCENLLEVELSHKHSKASVYLLRIASTNRRVVVVNSWFCAFSEKQSIKGRKTAILSMLLTMYLLVASDNLSLEVAKHWHSLFTSFMIRLTFAPRGKDDNDDDYDYNYDVCDTTRKHSDNCFRAARRIVFPNDHFKAKPKRVSLISNWIGITYLDLLYIREKIGEDRCNQLQKAYGLLQYQDKSPLELDFVCPGMPCDW
mmetsp:Transcript_27829/g.52194  ORF Transcript_27829/g.52194 Transcript_27829/m.52194 type:complete len:354 (+) Transcript_27829:1323-2384(+)